MRYANNLSEYERAIQEGAIDENVFVIVLDEKVAKFKGKTFDWNGVDPNSIATKEDLESLMNEMIDNEEVTASALNELDDRIGELESNITGEVATKEDLGSLQNDIYNKVDKVSGKQLSTEDFTTALKTKLNGLSNYDDTAIQNAVNSLTNQINTLVSGDASTAIESFNEIIAFLNGVTDSENLDSIIASIEQQIAGKMDAVTLAKVATSGSYNDLNDKPTIPAAVTESTVSGWGFTKNTGTYSKPSAGIPKSDLASDVQASLGKADSAIQNVKTINGESIVGEGNIEINVDTSTLVTKEELAEAEEGVNNTIIDNEEILASAINELNSRIATIESIISTLTSKN